MGAPPGNDNAVGNPGGPGAPEGNQRAVGNDGGAPELNMNAATHGASIPDEKIIARGEHDEFISEFVASVDMPADRARTTACSLIRWGRAARYLATEADDPPRDPAFRTLRSEHRDIMTALRDSDDL